MTTSIITLGMGARVFWSYFWRIVLISLGFGLAFGVVGGFLTAFLKASDMGMMLFMDGLMPPAIVLLCMKVMAHVFSRSYGKFTVALVDSAGTALPRNLGYGAKLWWSKFWRAFLIGLVLAVPIALMSGSFVKGIQQKIMYTNCMNILKLYQHDYAIPEKAASAKMASDKYQQMHCAEVLTQPVVESTHYGSLFLLGLVATVGGFFIQFKIFQILLRKKYSNFAVQVTRH